MAWQQATLPVRLGGFVLTSVKSIAACAFLASWVEAIDALPKRFPDLRVDLDLLLKGSSGSATGPTLKSLIPSNELFEYLPASGKLQKRLSNDLFESMSRDTVKSTRDAARIHSLHGAGAGAWVNAVTTSMCFALDSCVYRLASYLRLGLPVCSLEWLSSCQCGAVLDDSGYHLLTCKVGGGPVWSHESIANVWADCLSELHIPHRREPRHRYSNSDNRPDIIALDTSSGMSIDLDISLAHPWSSEVFPSSSKVDGLALKRREEKKKIKYQDERLPTGNQIIFKPLVIEHFCRWGDEGDQYLRSLGSQSFDKNGRHNSAQFMYHWRKRFSIQLQQCNARVIQCKMSSLGCRVHAKTSRFHLQ